MPKQIVITASLEGMQILVQRHCSELREYDFQLNRWILKETSPWPLSRRVAEDWVKGWNDVDRFAAINALVEPGRF